MNNRKRERWIDLQSLPHNKSQINWKECPGCKVAFKYDDIQGDLLFGEYVPKGKIWVHYNNKKRLFDVRCIVALKIGAFIGKIHYDWLYEVGQEVENSNGTMAQIISRYYKKTAMSSKSRFYSLQCSKCKQIYDKVENEVTSCGCPICNNNIVVKDVNDLWTTHPYVAKQLKNPEEGYNITYGQRIFLDWICPTCGREIKHKTPMHIIGTKNEQVFCENCSDGYSFPNKFFFHLLRELKVDFEAEKTFEWSERKRYDFYLFKYKMIIELQGAQHYDSRFPQIAINDRYKEKLAKNNGITNYVVIDCARSNAQYIFNNIKKALSDYFNFSDIDIEEIAFESNKKVVDMVIKKLQSNGFDVSETSKYFQIDRATISQYLNAAIRAGGFREEEVRELQRQNKIKQHYQLEGKPTRNIDTGEVFGNYTQIKEYFKRKGKKNFSIGSFVQGLKRSKGTSYGYHWERITREEFNNIKQSTPELAYGDFFIKVQDKG